jgi:hypothetical protein
VSEVTKILGLAQIQKPKSVIAIAKEMCVGMIHGVVVQVLQAFRCICKVNADPVFISRPLYITPGYLNKNEFRFKGLAKTLIYL